MRVLARMKDINGKVNLEISDEKQREKINKLFANNLHPNENCAKTHQIIGGKNYVDLSGRTFEENNVTDKNPLAVSSMLSGNFHCLNNQNLSKC